MALCGCGTFGEAMVVDEASVVAVETDLPDEELALLGCGVTTGLGAALNTAGVLPGSSVAVIGCGGVGQSVIQGARIAGASTIIAIDPASGRREASLGIGATHTVDPTATDPVAEVQALTERARRRLHLRGRRAARADGAGLHDGPRRGHRRPGGHAATRRDGHHPRDGRRVLRARRLVGSPVGGAQILRDFPRFIQLAESGKLDLGSMVSKRITLDEINDGLDLLNRAEGVRTVVV